MSDHGKKVGKFTASTVLGKYDLDVRLDMEDNQFVILVPRTPGEAVNTKLGRGVNYDSFRAATLADAKKSVEAFLAGRDVTDFRDVIEYDYLGSERDNRYREVQNSVGFDFRVARVSVAENGNGHPMLEISIDVDEDSGHIKVSDMFGEPSKPMSHRGEYDFSIPFTIERWRKCCAIRDGIAALGKTLTGLLGGKDDSAARLDSIQPRLQLSLSGLVAEEKIQEGKKQ